ncbi:hypothetical protein [Myceligenerans indicum]|uniref:Uncharacterized protein n=1 Tax=Myceligenerans indicum TaxID=2593663 RepID=A0ABS1LN43_9MICO|nr:hypothetical protein [Myceligenerans indicum]MBL0887603.1 hypothetical protein [Myceligenerans indicum]
MWRVAHPFRAGFAVRIIVWFPDDQRAVIALFGNNKAQMGDISYDSVGSRADQAIENYLRARAGDHKPEPQGTEPQGTENNNTQGTTIEEES